MASRRLALNLSQGLRGRAGGLSVPFRRSLATAHHAPIKTQTTTLKNGLTVSIHQLARTELPQPVQTIVLTPIALLGRDPVLALRADLDCRHVDRRRLESRD
jgi:hypothetical protein